MERLIALYWKPVYWHVRSRWRKSNEDAKELTQEFFTSLLERGALAQVRGEGRFRAFLRACLQHFLLQQHRFEGREKRGGGAPVSGSWRVAGAAVWFSTVSSIGAGSAAKAGTATIAWTSATPVKIVLPRPERNIFPAPVRRAFHP